MKRLVAMAAAAILIGALGACSSNRAVTTEEATTAFAVSYVSVMMASFGLAFDQEVEGASMDEETQSLKFDNFSLAEFFGDEDAGEDIGYTSISGTVSGEEDRMVANLRLEGGPVTTIEFSLGEAELGADEGFTTTVKVNGIDMEIELTPEDFGI